MSSNFPTTIDDSSSIPVESGVTPLATNHVNSHTNVRDSIIALETKVGVTSSAVTTTHDYKLSAVTGAAKAVSSAGGISLASMTLTGSTINGVTPTTAGSATTFLNGTGAYTTPATTNASTTVAGVVEAATSAEVTAGTATGGTGAVLAVTPDALAASTPVFNGSGLTNLTPTLFPYYHVAQMGASANTLYAASTDTTGLVMYAAYPSSGTALTIARYAFDTVSGVWYQTHTATVTAAAGNITNNACGITVIGSYVYVSFTQSIPSAETWRLAVADLTGAVQCTYSGGSPSTATNYRVSYTNGTNLMVCSTTTTWKQYTISGTTLTATTDVTTISGASVTGAVWDGTNVFFVDSSTIYKYTSVGASVSSLARQGNTNLMSPRGVGVGSVKTTIMWRFSGQSTTAIVCEPITRP